MWYCSFVQNEKALATLKKYSTNVDLLNHVRAVSACLGYFAGMAGEDETFWSEVGILHGLVYDIFYDKPNQVVTDVLALEKLCKKQIHAIMAHGFGSLSDVEPNCYMEYTFIAVDQIAGFAVSTEGVRDLATIKEMFANKDCAIGTARFTDMCKKMGKDPDWVLRESLNAVNSIANDLVFHT